MERECDSRDKARDDREPPQRRCSRESRPLVGDRREEREQGRSPVEPPTPREDDQRSPTGGLEDSTGEGSASTRDSCERDDPATPTPWREEAAELLTPAEAEALVAPPSPPPPNGGMGEERPRENSQGGQPPQPPNGHAPQKEGRVAEGQHRASGFRKS